MIERRDWHHRMPDDRDHEAPIMETMVPAPSGDDIAPDEYQGITCVEVVLLASGSTLLVMLVVAVFLYLTDWRP